MSASDLERVPTRWIMQIIDPDGTLLQVWRARPARSTRLSRTDAVNR
jgi:hypothetical protein